MKREVLQSPTGAATRTSNSAVSWMYCKISDKGKLCVSVCAMKRFPEQKGQPPRCPQEAEWADGPQQIDCCSHAVTSYEPGTEAEPEVYQ